MNNYNSTGYIIIIIIQAVTSISKLDLKKFYFFF